MLTLYLSLIDTQEERDKFERLFHQYERCLKYTAQNILFDEHLAEDAVQEAICAAFAARDGLRDVEKFKPWILRILTNKCYDAYRKKRPSVDLKRKRNKTQEESSLEEMMELDSDPEDEENRPDVLLLRREQEETILQVIRCLPPDYRYALTLKYAHGCNTAQLAALLNCSEKLARVKLSRARKSLMTRMEQVLAKSDQ